MNTPLKGYLINGLLLYNYFMNKINNAIFFAAGKGTRMAPITNHIPKPLVKINGEPIIERNIKFLHESGIKDISIVVGYLGKHFNYLADKYGVNIIENDMYEKTNNISSLYVSKDFWGNTLYVEGDIYLKENIFPRMINTIESSNGSIMFGARVDFHIEEWFFNLNEEGFVIDHMLGNASGHSIWTGMYFMTNEMSSEMRNGVGAWMNNNSEKYAEQYLWTLSNKFKLVEIDNSKYAELDNFSDLIKMDDSYATQEHYKLFTPGPTNVTYENWNVLSSGIVHHRSKLAEYYIKRAKDELKGIFKTENGEVLLITSSGTGAMESSVVSVANKKSLIINSGGFGERFADIHKAYGLNYTELKYENGKTYDLDEVEKSLDGVDVVYLTHHETSTGVLHDVEKLGKFLANKNIIFVVDAIASLIIEEFKFDEWGVDVALASSPKSFMLPPGISYVCISQKAKNHIKSIETKSFYFDLKQYIDYSERLNQTPFTPAISMILGTVTAIETIKNKSVDIERKNKRRIYNYINKELENIGFVNRVPQKLRTIAMIAMDVPDGINAKDMRDTISHNKHIYFEVGRLEKSMNMVRIGLLGPLNMDDAKELVEAIKKYAE